MIRDMSTCVNDEIHDNDDDTGRYRHMSNKPYGVPSWLFVTFLIISQMKYTFLLQTLSKSM